MAEGKDIFTFFCFSGVLAALLLSESFNHDSKKLNDLLLCKCQYLKQNLWQLHMKLMVFTQNIFSLASTLLKDLGMSINY